MIAPRFIQISMLSSYAAVLLNRDDAGLAKRMRFGGAVRTRVSSQCLKRHWRIAEDTYSLRNINASLKRSIRSREIFPQRIENELLKDGYDLMAIQSVLKQFIQVLYKGNKQEIADDDTDGDDVEQKNTEKHPLSRKEVIVLGEPEINFLIHQARGMLNEMKILASNEVVLKSATAKDAKSKEDAEKKKAKEFSQKAERLIKGLLKNKEAKENFKALANGAGIDAAMFGRFVSGDPEARISAAVHVAHALTVHAEAAETDYFTAVDDLTTASEGGSGHLGAAELTSGLFYIYAVVDVPQLVSNLTGEPFENWQKVDRSLAGRTVNHLIRLMATVSPGAKLGSTAPYDHAGLVLVEAGERQPRTLANAYLDPLPLPGGNLFSRAAAVLSGYLQDMDTMYEPEEGMSEFRETRWLACRVPTAAMPGFADCRGLSLPKLAKAVEDAIIQGGLA